MTEISVSVSSALFLASWVDATGSYAAACYALAGVVAILAVAALLVRVPAGAEAS